MYRVGKVLKIQPDWFVHFLQIFYIWNSNEQFANMKISKTLLVEFLIYRSGFTYILVLFEDSDKLKDT